MRVRMLRSLGRTKADVAAGVEERREGQTYDLPRSEAEALVKRGLAVAVETAPSPPPPPPPAPVKRSAEK